MKQDSYPRGDQLKLYTLIWEQFVASQMKPAVIRTLTADIQQDGIFHFQPSFLEEGFYKAIRLAASKEERTSHYLPFEQLQNAPGRKN